MGVRGLFWLINDNQSVLLADYKLHDTKLIIDGTNFYRSLYHFYHIRDEFGGDYDHYANNIRTYFRTLRACNVEPYVVLDGGYHPDDLTLRTVLRRNVQRRERVELISEGRREDIADRVLPILVEETFRQVLKEIGVPHVSCPYEAVHEIATLAARWRCPTLSNNGDFFIYRLEGGILPINTGVPKFMDMVLRIYDKDTGQSRIHTVDEGEQLQDNEFMYIAAKLYRYQRFLERVKGSPDILPVFATFCGNDYVDRKTLGYFNSDVCKLYKDNPINLRMNVRMASVLHWAMAVTSDEDALTYVLGQVEDKPQVSRSAFKNAALFSLANYRDIDQFRDLDLDSFFSEDNLAEPATVDSTIKLKQLSDHVTKEAMPRWSSERLRLCKMADSFVQNVVVNHRVLFDCQIEILDEPSSYVCSRYIRSVLYAIATTFKGHKKKASKGPVASLVDPGGSRNSCIEEYDRKKTNLEKVYVKATPTVVFGAKSLKVPSLEKMPEIDELQRMEIVFATLGLTPEDVETLGGAEDPASVFVMGVLYFWFRKANPRFSTTLVKAVILCIVRLHFIAVETEETRYKRCLIPSLAQTIYRQYFAGYKPKLPAQVEDWLNTSERDNWGDRERSIVHGLAQLQACYLNATHLNHALMSPIHLPGIGDLFNCTFICNMCKRLDGMQNQDTYLARVFTRHSPLHVLITRWWEVITSYPVNDMTIKSGKTEDSKGKKVSKHVGKHGK